MKETDLSPSPSPAWGGESLPPSPQGLSSNWEKGARRLGPKLAYVAVDHLAVAVERQRDPALDGRVVVVGGQPHERRAVRDVSTEGVRAGVRLGMPLRQAQQLCPDAAFLPPDEAAYERAREEFLALLEEFSPFVEPDGRDGAYLDASGLTLLFGADPVLAARIVAAVRERLGFKARVGIGPGKFVARLAARYAGERPVVVEAAESRQFLGRQPCSVLPLGPDGQDRLRRLGVRSVGQFAALPKADIALQLGAEGVRAHRLARGEDDAPLIPRAKPLIFRAAREFEPALEDGERFRRVAARLLEMLAARLKSAERSCRALTLRLELESGPFERSFQLRGPTADAAELLRAVDQLAKAEEWVGGVSRFEVALEGLGPAAVEQLGLFDAQRRRRVDLDQAVARIRRRFGDDRVKRIVAADEGAWLASRRYALRDYGD